MVKRWPNFDENHDVATRKERKLPTNTKANRELVGKNCLHNSKTDKEYYL